MNSRHTIKIAALSLLLVASGPTLFPHKAHAFLGGLLGGVTMKEYVLDPIAYGVNKAALSALTKSVINGINKGSNGSPAFVQDLNATLLGVGDAEAQMFVNDFLSNGSLDSVPWRDDVGQQVLANYFRNTSRDSFSLNNPYTLDQVSEDPQAFTGGDWSKGGLDAWMSVVLNPGNNPISLYQNAQNALNSRVASRQGQKITELAWANGMNATRSGSGCNNLINSLGGKSGGGLDVTMPVDSSALNQQLQDASQLNVAPSRNRPSSDPASANTGLQGLIGKESNLVGKPLLALDSTAATQPASGQTVDGINGQTTTGGIKLNGATQVPTSGTIYTYGQTSSAPTSSTRSGGNTVNLAASALECLNNPILTPGSLISHALNTFASDIGAQTYINNDEISELIGSLFGGLIGNALGSGGLSGTSQPSAGGGSSYINNATNLSGVQTAQSSLNLSNDFLTTISDQQLVLQDYQTKVNAIGAAAAAAKTALGTTTCPIVDQTIAQMGTASANATASVNAIDQIRSTLISGVIQDSSQQQTLVSTATTQYQQLQSSPTFPTARDIAVADSGHLLAQMQSIAATGQCQ